MPNAREHPRILRRLGGAQPGIPLQLMGQLFHLFEGPNRVGLAAHSTATTSELSVVPSAEVQPFAPPPKTLKPEAQALWRAIVASRPHNFFGPADLPLLREYVHTVATLLPRVNEFVEEGFDPKTLDAREKLIRVAASLAGKLRLHVASRTRPDTASMRDSQRRAASIDWSQV